MPFVFGHGPWLPAWAARVPAMPDCEDAVVVDVLADQSLPFFRLMNAANARAFGDLGMPAWVQLDCATLPTAMVGFAIRKRDLAPALAADLQNQAGVDVDDNALVPVAEFCALPTPEPGHVVGFSLFSLVAGLGVRAKALGLLVMGARVQTGVTQIDNTALRTHCRFGPLVVDKRGVQVHSKPGTTLVYRLQVPSSSTLIGLCTGSITRAVHAGPTRTTPAAELKEGDVVVDVVLDGIVIAA